MNHRSLMSLAFLFSLSLAACQPIHAEPAAQTIATTSTRTTATLTMEEQANQAVVQRVYDEVFNGKDLSVLDEVFDPNLVRHDLDVGGEAPGSRLPLTLIGFPDLHATVEVWVVEGNLVTAVVNFKGTHQGEYMGVAATGKPVSWSIIDVWQVKDGKITDLWHNVPNEDMLDQIGATPAQ